MIRLRYAACVLFLTALPIAVALSEEKADSSAKDAKGPRPLQISDAGQWKQIYGMAFSPDAKWCSYILQPGEGDATVVIQQLEGDKKYTFTAGRDSRWPAFSHDSQWAAFRSGALERDVKAAEKVKKPAPSKVVLVQLENGKQTQFEKADRFAFAGESAAWVAVHKTKPESQPSGADGWSGRDLILHELASGRQLNMGNVDAFAFNKSGKWLALTIDAKDKSGNGVQLFDTSASRILVLESDKAEYRNLSWTKEGDAFALLKAVESKDYENKLHHLLAFCDLEAKEPSRVHVDPAQDPGIPEEMTISPDRAPTWTKNRDAILFGIHDAKKQEQGNQGAHKQEPSQGSKHGDKTSEETSSQEADEEDPQLIIWHWKDKRLQSQQRVEESRDKQFSYLCIHRRKEQRTLRLADEQVRSVTPLPPHRFAVGFDNSKYQLMGTLHGRKYNDIYSIDLQTGKRKLVLKRIRWYDSAAPTGDQVLYFKGGHYHVYNLLTDQDRNITEGLPVSFVDDQNDKNVKKPPAYSIGWVKDGRAVLLRDNWDIWLVPASGGEAANLTLNGRKEAIRYRWRYCLDPDEEGIDLSQPMYVSAYGEWTKKSGIGRIKMGRRGVEMLLWDGAFFPWLFKVKDQHVYYYTRETYRDFPNYYVAGADLKDASQITDANPQQSEFLWSAGARLVDYRNKEGKRLQAALYLPAGYIKGKSYPTVVRIYEKLSDGLHWYLSPRIGRFSPAIYTSQGYAVLQPDIVYRINDPGVSALECVLPALEAAIDTGVVDPNRVGLYGLSWGGYQTAFLITQTDKFRAAVAAAAPTNLISIYNTISVGTGTSSQPKIESRQGRMAGGYWTNLEDYIRNSPVFHVDKVETPLLMLQSDTDEVVDWNQGVELFNALRRLRKPVVMLQYEGEKHVLEKDASRKDFSYRMLEFFDHHLKGKEAPGWWKNGVKYVDRKEHVKQYRKARAG